MRQADVTEADIRNVVGIWKTCLEAQDAGDIEDLSSRPVWHLFEAEQYVITAACTYLGMAPPRNVAFSCMDSIDGMCECEAVLFWSKKPSESLDSECFVEGAAVRLSEYRWPGFDLIAKTDEHVRYVIWRMSLLKTAMEKEAPSCILGR